MEPTVLAYAAGFFDGEGHVNYTRGIHVIVAQNDRTPLDYFQVLFGGVVRVPDRRHSRCYRWTLNGTRAKLFLEAILPYCIVKREDIQDVLERSQEGPMVHSSS